MQTIGQHMRRMGEDLPSDPDSRYGDIVCLLCSVVAVYLYIVGKALKVVFVIENPCSLN